MNKIFGVVWSPMKKQCLARPGRKSRCHGVVATLGVAAILGVAPMPAIADCGSLQSGTWTIDAATTTPCRITSTTSVNGGAGGVTVSPTGSITVIDSGSENGAITLVDLSGGGAFGPMINNGMITVLASPGHGMQIALGTLNGGIANAGTVNVSGFGIETGSAGFYASGPVVNSGTNGIAINNSGTIIATSSGSGRPDDGSGIFVGPSSVVNGNIANSGLIQAAQFGINITPTAANGNNGVPVINGNVINSGSISGGSYGIYNDGTIGGSVTNSGTVAGTTYAIFNAGTIADGMFNRGVLDGNVSLGAAALTLQGNAARVIGDITGAASITVTGAFTAEGNATTQGALTVNNGGSLALGNNETWTAASTTLGDASSSGTLYIGGVTTPTAPGTLDSSTVALANPNSAIVFNHTSADARFAPAISGSGTVTAASGTTTLTGVNSYTGTTTVADGATLKLAGSGSIAPSGMVADAGTFDISGTDSGASITNLSGSGSVALGERPLSITNASGVFDGVISGTGSLSVDADPYVLTGANTYTGGTAISGGTLQLGSGGTTGSIVGNVTDNGTLAFDRSDSVVFDGSITGTGAVLQAGTGTTVLNGVSDYSGGTGVSVGTLAVGDAAHANAMIGPGVTTVADGATLGGFGTVSGPVDNAGTIAVANALPVFSGNGTGTLSVAGNLVNRGMATAAAASGQIGNVLDVGGSYTGVNGQLALNTLLNEGGAASRSDRLVVGGNANGSTGIRVNGSGGGAQTVGDGIELVQVGGVSAANGFALSRPVQAGAYEYLLYQGGADGAQNWYLRSQLESPNQETPASPPPPVAYRPGVAGYTMMPLLDVDYGFSVLGGLDDRVGDIASLEQQQQGNSDGVWGRIGGQSLNTDSGRFSADARNYFAQFGKDWTLGQQPNGGSTHAGVTLTFGSTSANFYDTMRSIDPILTDSTGTAEMQAQTIGGYFTKYLPNGSYSDSVAQASHFLNHYGDVDGDGASQNGYGFALSEEVGEPFQIGGTRAAIEPQMQLMYQYVNLHGFDDAVSPVSGTVTNALRGRIGMRLFSPDLQNDLHTGAATPYFTADILHDFLAPGETSVGGTVFQPASGRTWYELGFGVTASYHQQGELYANVKYQRNVGGDYRQGFAGQVGYRYSW